MNCKTQVEITIRSKVKISIFSRHISKFSSVLWQTLYNDDGSTLRII